MASASTINTDQSLLSRSDQLFFRFESFLTLVGGITILMLVLLAVCNILGRWLFNLPVMGYIDWVEQFMAIFAFAGIAYCQREGGHIRMDIFLAQLKVPRIWIAEFASVLFMLFITIVVIYGSFLHFLRAFQNGDSSMDVGLPIWPAKLMIPFALSLLAIRLMLQLWAYGRAIRYSLQAPVAVPLIEDAATQAAREAESVQSSVANSQDAEQEKDDA